MANSKSITAMMQMIPGIKEAEGNHVVNTNYQVNLPKILGGGSVFNNKAYKNWEDMTGSYAESALDIGLDITGAGAFADSLSKAAAESALKAGISDTAGEELGKEGVSLLTKDAAATGVKEAGNQLLKHSLEGAGIGLGYGISSGMQSDDNLKTVLLSGGVGAIGGALLPLVFGGTLAALKNIGGKGSSDVIDEAAQKFFSENQTQESDKLLSQLTSDTTTAEPGEPFVPNGVLQSLSKTSEEPIVVPGTSDLSEEEQLRAGQQPPVTVANQEPFGESPPAATSPRGVLQSIQENPDKNVIEKASASSLEQNAPVIHDVTAANAAARRISADPDAAYVYATNPSEPASSEKTATQELLSGQLSQKYMDSGMTDGDAAVKLKTLQNFSANEHRAAGQAIQILYGMGKLSPTSFLKMAEDEAETAGQKLSEDFKTQVLARMSLIRQMPEGDMKNDALKSLLSDVGKQLPMKFGSTEWWNNYRYQNMLLSPTSAGKISLSGALNGALLQPATLFGRAVFDSTTNRNAEGPKVGFDDWSAYMHGYFGAGQKALAAFQDAFHNGVSDYLDEEKGNAQILSDMRKKNIPLPLRIATSTHTALYSYFSTLIEEGEKNRLIGNGVSEEDAATQARALADKLTLRSSLHGYKGPPIAKLVNAIGESLQDLGNKKGAFGKLAEGELNPVSGLMKWVVPFMKVSTNWAKLGIEYSPLALIDNPKNYDSETLSKAFIGSAATGVGAMLAASGRVTWGVPSDPTAADDFYASGRKPYSVLIGDTWIPLNYFGALGISMGLPAAIRDATQGQNTGQSGMTKLENVVKNASGFVVQNTPLPSLATFFNYATGNAGVTPANMTKFVSDLADQYVPAESFLRYVTNLVDPIYRQASTITQRIESGIPGMSQNLPAYTDPNGNPEKKNLSSLAPYSIGVKNNEFDEALQERNSVLASNSIGNAVKKLDAALNNGTITQAQYDKQYASLMNRLNEIKQ